LEKKKGFIECFLKGFFFNEKEKKKNRERKCGGKCGGGLGC
jgi:hypothetical protein